MSLRSNINKLLRPYGYVIEKIDRFMEALVYEYDNSKDFCFVQIGANDGIKFDDLYHFIAARDCRGLVVEPIKYYYEILKTNYGKFPNIIPVNRAIHKTEKRATIHYVDPEKLPSLPIWAQGIGSFDSEHYKNSNTPQEVMISEEVDCVELMALINEHGFNEIHLLQIDTEGYDGEVIKMIDFNAIVPRVIRYEHGILEETERQEVEDILLRQNYALFEERNNTIAIQNSTLKHIS